jgi:hypothetical protein
MNDIRNILDILTEAEAEVKPILPEGNPSADVSDLTKANTKFTNKGTDTWNSVIQGWDVSTLPEFVKDEGFTPTYIDLNKKESEEEEEELNEYDSTVRYTTKCPKCLGDGMKFGKERTSPIQLCDECLGWGKLGDGEPYYGPNVNPAKEDEIEELNSKIRLNRQEFEPGQKEFDFEQIDEVLDAPTKKLDRKDLSDYLDRIINQKKKKTDKYKKPYIHRSTVKRMVKGQELLASDKQVPIVNQDGETYDLEALAADITVRPTKLLKQNAKMQHTEGPYKGQTEIYFDLGLPALNGLGYNEEKREFVEINTCPGAGECKTFCYALKGGYVQWENVAISQTRRLNYLYNDPVGFFEQLNTEIDIEANKLLKSKQGETVVMGLRWHDAGDFFSEDYLEAAYKVAMMHPDVRFYAYTKMASVSNDLQNRPDNFIINFSAGAAKGQERKIDFGTTKSAMVVKKEMFNDLLKKDGNKLAKDPDGAWQFKDDESFETFKERLMLKYPGIKPDTLITYKELMQKPLPGAFGQRNMVTPKWNVIVMSGEGDAAANRPDVLGSYLLEH